MKEFLVIGVLAVLVATLAFSNISPTTGLFTQEQFHLKGWVCVYKNGQLLQCGENIVVNQGKNYTRDDLTNQLTIDVRDLALANCTGAQAATDTDLCAGGADVWQTCGLVNKTATYQSRPQSPGNWSLTAEWTSTCQSVTVNGTGMYNSSPSSLNGGTLFAQNNFTTVTLNTDDKLNVTYYVWIT